jgi:hypothetical protein
MAVDVVIVDVVGVDVGKGARRTLPWLQWPWIDLVPYEGLGTMQGKPVSRQLLP